MSNGVKRVDVDAIRARYTAAREMVRRLCLPRGNIEHRDWLMSVPADETRDPDLVIHRALHDIPALLDALAAAEAENARLRTALEHYASADSWTAPTTSTPYVGLWWGNGNRYFRDIYVGAYDDGANVARKALGDAAPATREE